MKILHLFLCLLMAIPALSQSMTYEPSTSFPFGMVNPEAPAETSDFTEMIGSSECISVQRQNDGTWLDSLRMIWNFKYIMNGTAVQDEVFLEDGRYAGSLRQYNADSAKWFVSYYSSGTLPPYPVWTGIREGNKIVLHGSTTTVNKQDGKSRLTFYELDENNFKWIGEWFSLDGTIEFVFWKITCTKIRDNSSN